MENKQNKMSFQVLAVITTPKLAEKTADMLKKNSLPLTYRFSAEGTASSEIMDMLGLGSVDKCMLVSMIPKHLSGDILKKLHTELKLDTVNSGIAFTITLNGANNLILHMLNRYAEEKTKSSDRKDENSMAEAKHALIMAVVNRGFSSDVMEAARSAGARGGTVIHSHYVGSGEATGFWGITVQEESEIILIISDVENKVSIMQSILDKCGMNSDAKGIAMSMPIDSVLGL